MADEATGLRRALDWLGITRPAGTRSAVPPVVNVAGGTLCLLIAVAVALTDGPAGAVGLISAVGVLALIAGVLGARHRRSSSR